MDPYNHYAACWVTFSMVKASRLLHHNILMYAPPLAYMPLLQLSVINLSYHFYPFSI